MFLFFFSFFSANKKRNNNIGEQKMTAPIPIKQVSEIDFCRDFESFLEQSKRKESFCDAAKLCIDKIFENFQWEFIQELRIQTLAKKLEKRNLDELEAQNKLFLSRSSSTKLLALKFRYDFCYLTLRDRMQNAHAFQKEFHIILAILIASNKKVGSI